MPLLEEIGGKQYFSSDVKRWLQGRQHENLISMLKSYGNLASIVDCDGRTLLHLSASCNNGYMTKYLINENLDVNAVDILGETPLMSAIHDKDLISSIGFEVCGILLEAGADLWNIKNHRGQCVVAVLIEEYRSYPSNIPTMLMNEIEKRSPDMPAVADILLGAGYKLYHLNIFKKVEITKLMIERGCPVNLQDPRKCNPTALHIAASENDLDSAKLLLQHGADRKILDLDGLPPVTYHFFSKNQNLEMIRLLLPDGINWTGNNKFIIYKLSRKEVLKFLVQYYGIKLNYTFENGYTSLHYFAENKDPGVWELLENVEVVDAVTNYYGHSALHVAMSNYNPTAVRFLLDAGANVNLLDSKGRSPLLYFAKQMICYVDPYQQECLELLMQAGADAQLVNHNGETIVSLLMSGFTKQVFAVDPIAHTLNLINPILTHLAIGEALGVKLNPVILSHIDSNNLVKDNFVKYKREIDEMKNKTISGTVTFIKFLTAEDEKIWKYARNDDVFKELSNIRGDDYLQRLLVKRFERAVEIGRWHSVARRFINECIQPIGENNVVLEKIMDYLGIKQWKIIGTSLDDNNNNV